MIVEHLKYWSQLNTLPKKDIEILPKILGFILRSKMRIQVSLFSIKPEHL